MKDIDSKNEINNEFKKYLNNKDYYECNEIIKNIIIKYVIELINQNIPEPKIKYTNINDLINFSEKYIKTNEKNIASKIENHMYEETEIEELERLLILCNTYEIVI